MAATTPIMKISRIAMVMMLRLPVFTSVMVLTMAPGRPTTIPAKMINEIPLPIPRSVICSPSHMTKAVPVVRVSTVNRRKPQPCRSSGTNGAPPGAVVRSRKKEMPIPWMTDNTTVPYRVYCVIFRRPSSPSFESFSR